MLFLKLLRSIPTIYASDELDPEQLANESHKKQLIFDHFFNSDYWTSSKALLQACMFISAHQFSNQTDLDLSGTNSLTIRSRICLPFLIFYYKLFFG